MKLLRPIFLTAVLMLCFGFQTEHKAEYDVSLELVAENLVSPIGMAWPNDGSDRKFIIEQRGLIYIINKEGKLVETPFLDISKKVVKLTSRYDERGLLGLAFHPNFKENGRFFVYYSSAAAADKNDHVAILSEYKVDLKNRDKANPASEKVILRVPQPEWNHNGGQLLFDEKGFLLVGLGDGGSGGDPHGTIGNAQNINNVLGKIIRIDIDSKIPYGIPQDNPFVGKDGSDEIYAYGLRNPWRFSIDKKTGRLFCGDVGQNKYEEVNIIEKGKNYGWRIMEGYHTFNEQEAEKAKNIELIAPITEYSHDLGASVTGGYVYRGKSMKDFEGKYIFGDWRGILFTLSEQPDKTWKREQLSVKYPKFKDLNINSFGEDQQGEIYIMAQELDGPFQLSGKVFRLKQPD